MIFFTRTKKVLTGKKCILDFFYCWKQEVFIKKQGSLSLMYYAEHLLCTHSDLNYIIASANSNLIISSTNIDKRN